MIRSINPATSELVYETEPSDKSAVDQAIQMAQVAYPSWKKLGFHGRVDLLRAYAKALTNKKDYLARTISEEMGKPLWESHTEVQAMINKVEISITAHLERCHEKLTETVNTRFHPHGIVAVFGPFNFPGHLPNGHIVPALLAGNVILFKPSEKTPKVGAIIAELMAEAKIPKGVFTLLQGARQTAEAILTRPEVAGLFFTGSVQVGQSIQKQSLAFPGRILALEMGGNNPLVVTKVANIPAAVYTIIQSAFITSGQRCSCARRLIITDDAILEPLIEATKKIKVGPFTDTPEPYMGPVVSKEAADHLEQAYHAIPNKKLLLPLERYGNAFIRPTIIEVQKTTDEEFFGPLLQVIRVKDLGDAIKEANNSAFGLSAGLISDSKDEYDQFLDSVRAGVINRNMPTTGASSLAPFGGVGCSGNYRPSAYFAADYASYPIASQESEHVQLPKTPTPGLSL